MQAKKLLVHLIYLTLTATENTIDCDHICMANCRRVGCNCECGEWHEPSLPKMEFIGTSAQWQKVENIK